MHIDVCIYIYIYICIYVYTQWVWERAVPSRPTPGLEHRFVGLGAAGFTGPAPRPPEAPRSEMLLTYTKLH